MANEAERRGYDKDPEVLRVMKQQMISKFPPEGLRIEAEGRGRPRRRRREVLQGAPRRVQPEGRGARQRGDGQGQAKADKAYAEAKALPKTAVVPSPDQKQFKDIVNKYSDDEDAKQRAGDLGFFDKETTRYPKAVVEAAFKLAEVGDVAQPIKTDKGWSVVRLTQKRPGFNRPLAEVKRQIQQRLFRDTRTKAMDNFVAELKKKSAIEVNDANLSKVVIDTGTGAGGPMTGAPGMTLSPPGMAPGVAPMPPPGTPAARPVPQGRP
jgi:hypothetical protein